ncbi:MAG: hypothetical protein MZU84_04610 [Sphingobacterium sp.]|nr:hypothetical protein [Sphingobacterium sp.]
MQPYSAAPPTHGVERRRHGAGLVSRWPGSFFYIRRLGTTEPWTIEMFSVPIATHPTPAPGIPRRLFTTTYHFHSATSGYDVTRDGRRFLMVPFNEKPLLKVAEVVLVQNWVEELEGEGDGQVGEKGHGSPRRSRGRNGRAGSRRRRGLVAGRACVDHTPYRRPATTRR